FAWDVQEVGDARLQFRASLGNEQDAFAWTLPVALPTTKETSATFASTDGTAQEALRLPADRIDGLGGLSVRLSSTALAGLDGAADFLFTYPYGCLEQRTSATRPLFLADALLDAFDLSVLGGTRDEAIAAWTRELRRYWADGEYGGFSLWPGSPEPNPYVSAYT